MKVVLFAGGRGLRMREFSETLPKPLVPVAGKPILQHLMHYYSRWGHREFIVCLGWGADAIRDWLAGRDGELPPDWTITLVDTGIDATIGERLRRVEPLIGDDRYFLANYADGISDLDLDDMVEEVVATRKVAGFLCVKPPQSLHLVEIDSDSRVTSIEEMGRSSLWVNGGYFVFRRDVFRWILPGEELVNEPFQRLIEAGELHGQAHRGFWRCMDTPKDREALENLIAGGALPWAGGSAGAIRRLRAPDSRLRTGPGEARRGTTRMGV